MANATPPEKGDAEKIHEIVEQINVASDRSDTPVDLNNLASDD